VTKSRKASDTGRSRTTRTKSTASRKKSKPAAKTKPKVAATVASRTSATVDQPACDDEAAYVESLVATGQAARLDKEGKLPAGATHKIVEDEAGNVKVVRRRFSIT
jgi:hypothetical protein